MSASLTNVLPPELLAVVAHWVVRLSDDASIRAVDGLSRTCKLLRTVVLDCQSTLGLMLPVALAASTDWHIPTPWHATAVTMSFAPTEVDLVALHTAFPHVTVVSVRHLIPDLSVAAIDRIRAVSRVSTLNAYDVSNYVSAHPSLTTLECSMAAMRRLSLPASLRTLSLDDCWSLFPSSRTSRLGSLRRLKLRARFGKPLLVVDWSTLHSHAPNLEEFDLRYETPRYAAWQNPTHPACHFPSLTSLFLYDTMAPLDTFVAPRLTTLALQEEFFGYLPYDVADHLPQLTELYVYNVGAPHLDVELDNDGERYLDVLSSFAHARRIDQNLGRRFNALGPRWKAARLQDGHLFVRDGPIRPDRVRAIVARVLALAC